MTSYSRNLVSTGPMRHSHFSPHGYRTWGKPVSYSPSGGGGRTRSRWFHPPPRRKQNGDLPRTRTEGTKSAQIKAPGRLVQEILKNRPGATDCTGFKAGPLFLSLLVVTTRQYFRELTRKGKVCRTAYQATIPPPPAWPGSVWLPRFNVQVQSTFEIRPVKNGQAMMRNRFSVRPRYAPNPKFPRRIQTL